MTDTDTSDEASSKFYGDCLFSPQMTEAADVHTRDCAMAMWREAVRRCEARMEVQANQHIETLAKAMGDNVRLIIEKKKLEERMEERERKAFEAGFDCGIDDLDLDECYRAFKEGTK